jgi:hypothetical protein
MIGATSEIPVIHADDARSAQLNLMEQLEKITRS